MTFANFHENTVIVLAEIGTLDFPNSEEEQSECHRVFSCAGALLVSVNMFVTRNLQRHSTLKFRRLMSTTVDVPHR